MFQTIVADNVFSTIHPYITESTDFYAILDLVAAWYKRTSSKFTAEKGELLSTFLECMNLMADEIKSQQNIPGSVGDPQGQSSDITG